MARDLETLEGLRSEVTKIAEKLYDVRDSIPVGVGPGLWNDIDWLAHLCYVAVGQRPKRKK